MEYFLKKGFTVFPRAVCHVLHVFTEKGTFNHCGRSKAFLIEHHGRYVFQSAFFMRNEQNERHGHVHACVYVHVYVCVYMCISIYIYIYIYIYKQYIHEYTVICFTDEKHEADDDPPLSVCPFKTHPCVRRKRHHTAHTPRHNTRHNRTTTPHGERERDRDRDRERREDEREDDKTREERRFIFSVVVHGPFSVDGVLCLVNPSMTGLLSLLISVKYDSSLISFGASWQGNSFFYFCEIISLCSFQFHF